ncbi:glycoside hydrolase family 2 protein [Cohnella sp. GCM10027633]|uniref:glycoside hydrolase family 2 protein n=1 Tax=unclassified Cohnella TaxID=2636738 RepID=UPI00362B28AB
MTIRAEYPRPQFVREQWLNLNGQWQFDFDDGNVGVSERWYEPGKTLAKKIEVPFAYQTPLSGIHDPSFHDFVWYKRTFAVDPSWKGKRVKLHFGAVDYRAWVYVNGVFVGTHEGGHTPFGFDVTDALTGGEECVTVRVEDPSEDETIPRGKQSWFEKPASIWYNRTTGIWQTVWLEAVDACHIANVKFYPDVDKGEVAAEIEVSELLAGAWMNVEISFQGETVVRDRIELQDRFTRRTFDLFARKVFRTSFHGAGWTWSPENPNLFDVVLTLGADDATLDRAETYFGMRKVHTENGMVYLNNRPYYQKLVLDQGYWPEGLLTAPSDAHLRKDIELAKEMGFNGCRKHQKVEDPRFLYWADRLGFVVWGECAASPSYSNDAVGRLTKEWLEIVERDFNHPSILTWVPINESWGVPSIRGNKQQQHHSLAMYSLIHSLDPTRLVISNDGWEMTVTDICAVHNYHHGNPDEPAVYEEFIRMLSTRETMVESKPAKRSQYAEGFSHRGEPILLTEFGGIGYKIGEEAGWGYTSVTTEEDFVSEYARVMAAVYSSNAIHGYCYTQLTDVEQEINGLVGYDRTPKCDLARIKAINDAWHFDFVR